MTEVDNFFEETAMKVEEPVMAPASNSLDYAVFDNKLLDDAAYFDEEYADEIPLFAPKTKIEAMRRLKESEKQFSQGNWHSLEDVMSNIRSRIGK